MFGWRNDFRRPWSALGVALGLVVLCPAITHAAVGPEQMAMAVEHRAETTSFADLERFGIAATHMPGREGLRRLHYVAAILLNQSEFERFERFNGALKRAADEAGDTRYQAVAEINRLKSLRDQGDSAAAVSIREMAQNQQDWFVRVYAGSLVSMRLSENNQTAEALKMLSASELLIPPGDPDAPAAEALIWENIGLVLMDLSDLRGSAAAFQRSEFEFGRVGYPRPDFDSIYNLGRSERWAKR